MIPFRLPDVGEGVTEAVIVKWLVQEGELVQRDQTVVEIQTDKAVVELPSPQEGFVREIRGQVNEVVKVGEVLYIIEPSPLSEVNNQIAQNTDHIPTQIPSSISIQELTSSTINATNKPKKILASPALRKRARQLGIDLTGITGSGPKGRIIHSDLERALTTSKASNFITKKTNLVVNSNSVPISSDETFSHSSPSIQIPLTPIRKVIARRLLLSTTNKPHATHLDQIDVSGLVAWRNQYVQPNGSKFSYTAILLKMISCVLRQYPIWNSHLEEETQMITQYPSIHIGIATDTPRGLLVPVIKEVQLKSMEEISLELQELVSSARSGKLQPNQMSGSTFTISNAGGLGGEWATPIIQTPEIGILAIHPIRQVPIVNETGELDVGWRMNVSLSFDHRVVDGADAICFTQTLQRLTQEPDRMVAILR